MLRKKEMPLSIKSSQTLLSSHCTNSQLSLYASY